MSRLILGTRGSDLARAQTSLVENALRAACSELELAREIITTRGDEKNWKTEPIIDRHAGRKGLFTREIERALIEGEIDVAIHSAKDLPSETTPGLEICAALPRAAIEDVLIAKHDAELNSIGTIGTGSVRRQHQLRWQLADLEIVDLRGNVPTRLRKLLANPWDAIVLARAGLDRLGFDLSRGSLEFEGIVLSAKILPIEQFLPAGGQGVVALQIRSDDDEARRALGRINHRETLWCLRAEREFLRLLQGDCGTPVGVLATIADGAAMIRAQIFEAEQREPRVAELSKTTLPNEPEILGAELWERINGG